MERRVFISHAAGDADWPEEQVEAVAEAIRATGVAVSLDLWRQRDAERNLSLSEWMHWMDDQLESATHVLCLVSPHYRTLWGRKPGSGGGFGVAFEAIRLVHALYLQKQHNHGFILTLRPPGRGYDCIPLQLTLDCPTYAWTADRVQMLSHLGKAALPLRGDAGDGRVASPPASPPPATPAPRRLAWASASGRDEYGHWADLTVDGAIQRMRWIEPTGPDGFWMGEGDERRLEVVAAGFWLADTPCTQSFWQAVTGNNPSHFKSGADAPQRPVESVSWDRVMTEFITRLAARPGWGAGDAVCLPSEVEWEHAARGATTSAYWWGNEWDAQRGNVDVTGKRRWSDKEGTTPVKRYPASPWGLFDVHGNVWECCEDVWRERRDAPEARQDSDRRVVRGGSWFALPGDARAACRGRWPRWGANRHQGFRFALRSPEGPEAR